ALFVTPSSALQVVARRSELVALATDAVLVGADDVVVVLVETAERCRVAPFVAGDAAVVIQIAPSEEDLVPLRTTRRGAWCRLAVNRGTAHRSAAAADLLAGKDAVAVPVVLPERLATAAPFV